MSKRMLIDASHPEETRVVVLDGQKVEEFDFEAASKRPLKGNIYLAKVTRVEPSLQAAFVEYGGNRQGFLAFSEIHPDYYQIPVADRMALIAEAEAEARRRQDDDVESFEIASGPRGSVGDRTAGDEEQSEETAEDEDETAERDAGEETIAADVESAAATNDESGEDGGSDSDDIYINHAGVADDAETEDETLDAGPDGTDGAEHDDHPPSEVEEIAETEIEQGVVDEQSVAASPPVEGERAEFAVPDPEVTDAVPDIQTASEPAEGETASAQTLQSPRPRQRWMRRRHYKIQEVIKRRQIILVQVVKEERGNKGAALTTYLSLAGRYCVLMPNTPRGGGISRKITNAGDRNRLKAAAQSLELPEGMGLIIRTAGENRTKIEIKRDYEYLLRLWDTIRELTLKSNAPACVYEEGDLIKRAIRDLYNKDVNEVLVEGDDGYRNAKEFMRMLMPSHAKNVKQYKEPIPLFQRHHIEAQLDAMFSPTVTLRSGGYIVINQTEALVSIDVNSGRATREHSIEETAHKTNLEAADEIGRQLRLRDLAGLIVIDFIDMEDARNDRDVEKRLRDAVKNDRARVQIGKISQFGLLEMSRQRLRAGVIAGSTVPCPHCGGQGIVRSVESTALRVLRGLEEEGQKLRASAVSVRVANDVAIYTLNQKRKELARIENDYGMAIGFEPKEGLLAGTFEIERTSQKTAEERARYAVSVEAGFAPPQFEPEPEAIEAEIEEEEAIEDEEILAQAETDVAQAPQQPVQGEGGRRRRRRRGGRNRNRDRDHRHGEQPRANGEPHADFRQAPENGPEHARAAGEFSHGLDESPGESLQPQQPGMSQMGDGRRRRRRRRRGRRGGAFQREDAQPSAAELSHDRFGDVDEIDTTPRDELTTRPAVESQPAVESPAPAPIAAPNTASTPVWSLSPERNAQHDSEAGRDLREQTRSSRSEEEPAPATAADEPPSEHSASQPARKGWWQRAFRSGD